MKEEDIQGLRVGYGFFEGGEAFSAGAGAAGDALEGLDLKALSTILVFASVRYDLDELLRGVHSVVKGAPVLGVTTAGEICNRPLMESVVVVALACRQLSVRIGLGESVSRDWKGAVAAAAGSPELAPYFSPGDAGVWRDLTLAGKSAFAIVFSPGNTRYADSLSFEIIEELKRLSSGRIPFFGGGAADDWRMEYNAVLLGRKAYRDSLLIAVFETGVTFGIAMDHGFLPTIRTATASRVRGHEILALDGSPASEVYCRIQGRSMGELEGKHLTLATGSPMGILDLYGQYTINVASYITPDSGVRFTQPVPEGTVLTVMGSNGDGLIAAGLSAVRKAILRGGINDPAVIFVFSCGLRHRLLGERRAEEISNIVRMFPGVPVAGFYSFGEQGLSDEGVNRHSNNVITALVIGKEPSYSLRVALENERLLEEVERSSAERRLAEDALVAAYRRREELEKIVNRSPAVVFLCRADEDWPVEFVSENVRQFGFSPEDFYSGRVLYSGIIHPDDIDRVSAEVSRQCGLEGVDGFNQEYRIVLPSGEVRWVDARTWMRRNDGGEITHFDGLILDITDRRQAHDALQKERDFTNILVQDSPAFFVAIRSDGSTIMMNDAMLNAVGYTQEEVKDVNYISTFVPEEDRESLGKVFARLTESREQTMNENRVLCKDGRILLVEWHGRTIHDEKGRFAFFFGVGIDITQRRHLEAELRKAQRMEAIGSLAGGVAHDFNNLLMGIQGRTSLMLMDKGPSHQDFEHLKGIEEYVKSAAGLTKQLLGFARGGKYEVLPTDLNELIGKGARMFGRTRKEVEIHEKLAPDLWPAEVDRGQIDQVLLNLFVNAWHSMPGGGDIFIETENVVLSEDIVGPFGIDPGRYVKITVSDTGTGMDRKTRERIFDPFFTTKEMGRGTGLGLASTYGIIKNHKGIINVESEKGRGTTFSICLPASEKEVRREIEPPGTVLRGSETVLLVDDEEMILEVGRRMLERMGYRVLTARSGKELLEIYERRGREIDLVILDMVMPGMGGGEAFDRLKRMDPRVRVLLSSGYSLDGQTNGILARGCRGFIQKPFNINELSRRLRSVMGRGGVTPDEQAPGDQ